MRNQKNGFTMLELIFVIVIIGILAVIAIPRLSSTSSDAKISKLAYNIQTAKTEIATSIFAKGKIPKTVADLRGVSNTVIELEKNGDILLEENSTAKKVYIYFINKYISTKEKCKEMILDYSNNSNIELSIQKIASSSSICRGINSIIQDINMTIAGNRVGF
jgi:prepilin-type N-terminal cleavage/methylation domain-containing protein